MTMCDVAMRADAEAVLSAGPACGEPPRDCIMHAGGVLKVNVRSPEPIVLPRGLILVEST